MKEIEEKLIKIVNQQLDECTENKTTPSEETLKVVQVIITLRNLGF